MKKTVEAYYASLGTRVILERLETAVDSSLRDHQAGFLQEDRAQTK